MSDYTSAALASAIEHVVGLGPVQHGEFGSTFSTNCVPLRRSPLAGFFASARDRSIAKDPA